MLAWALVLGAVGAGLAVLAFAFASVERASAQPAPPATFAGQIRGLTPRDGLVVRAEMNGLVCGLSATFVIDGVLRYRVHVDSRGAPDHLHCGVAGSRVYFYVDGVYAGSWTWDAGLTVLDLDVVNPPEGGTGPNRTPTVPAATPKLPTTAAGATPAATPIPPATGPGETPAATGEVSSCRSASFPEGHVGCGHVVAQYNDPASPRHVLVEATLDEPEAVSARARSAGTAPACEKVQDRSDCRANLPLYLGMVAFIRGGSRDLFPDAAQPVPGLQLVSGRVWRWDWEGLHTAPDGVYRFDIVLQHANGEPIATFLGVTITLRTSTPTPTSTPTATPTSTSSVSPIAAPTVAAAAPGARDSFAVPVWAIVIVGVVGLLAAGGGLWWVVGFIPSYARRGNSPDVFLSYRRGDAAGWTGRIFDRLVKELGDEHVFQDIVDIEGGVDWVDELHEKVATCDVLIALIGERWVGSQPDGTRRIDKDDDWVRLETARALAGTCVVIPVLVDGMKMGALGELPEDLSRLRRRNAIEISAVNFEADMQRLTRAIRSSKSRRRPR